MRFDFLLSEVLTGLRRNVTMTVAMILTTAISIGLFGGGLLVLRLAENSKQIYLERVQSQVFLDADISANDPTCDGQACRQLLDAIDTRADVASVQFFSREENYQELIAQLPTFADSVTESSVQATLMVKLTDPESDAFAAEVGQLPGVESITNQLDLVDRLFAILDGLRNVAFAVALVQAVGAILLIANMIQVSAFTRRTEIGIMRLVGASRWYTQLPFLLEAMLAALVGVVIAIAGLVAVRAWFFDDVLQQFYEQNVIAPVDYADILYISPYLALTALSIAAVTAYVTLRLYVRR